MELNRLSLFLIVIIVLIFTPIMFVVKWIKILTINLRNGLHKVDKRY